MRTPSDGPSWAVVGGGFLGMTLALRLAQAGRRVTLFESAGHLGGLASAWRLADVVWDRHYHVTLESDRHLLALLRELDLDGDLEWARTRTGFFVDGRLYSMSNAAEFVGFPPLGLIDKARLGATILHAAGIKDWRPLEAISAIDWLTAWSGRHTVEKIWRPLLRAKLGENYTKASAAFIWAIIARMYSARRTGAKTERFGYVSGGYHHVLARFAEVIAEAGVEVRTGTPVQRVEADSDGGIRLVIGGERDAVFDNAVVTLASPLAARLVAGLSPAEDALLRGVQYQGIVCASVLLKNPLGGYYVTNITDDWVPFTAVIEMSALVDRRHFNGSFLAYLPKYVDPADPLFERSDDEIRETFLAALERMYPHFSRADVLAFQVSRVRYVVPISTIGYSDRLPPMQTSVPGLWTVGSAHIVNGTLNVNETVGLAEKAADMLIAVPARPAHNIADQPQQPAATGDDRMYPTVARR